MILLVWTIDARSARTLFQMRWEPGAIVSRTALR